MNKKRITHGTREIIIMFSIEIIVAALVLFVTLVILYFKWRHSYWERKDVPYIKPSIPWGSTANPFSTNKSLFVLLQEFYNDLKSKGFKEGGLYTLTKPVYMPVDVNIVKKILAKDFQHFIGHGGQVDERNDPLSGNLLNLEGEKWRKMRVKMTPIFTSGKMKMMFQTLVDCADPMFNHIDSLCNERKPLDIKEILACFTTDVVGSCAFGLECNSFKDPDSEFRKYGKKVFTGTTKGKLRRILNSISPTLRKKLLGNSFGDDVTQFFINITNRVVDFRESNNYYRNDFVQLLLELKQKADPNDAEDKLSVEQMAAQSFVFFAAGFETSSTTMTFCLYELAQNQSIQEMVRKEINTTIMRHGGKLTYESIMEMVYLNQVVEETLRKYPPGAALIRICNKQYTVEETGTVVEVGTPVFISVLGIHRDPQYYLDPDKFDPERFTNENKSKRPAFSYIPFGEGPRICIGMRFGLMQTKVGLCLLLKNYIFTPSNATACDMEFQTGTVVLSWRNPLFLNAQRIS